MSAMIGVIGGSGIYEIDGLQNARWVEVATPWGAASDQILLGAIAGQAMAFLPRHGRGHVHAPTDVPYRANIDALKRLGVTDVVSVSACGSFRETLAPGDFVLVDQFIDRTFAREKSFFFLGVRRSCQPCAPHLRPPWRCHRGGGKGGGYSVAPGRHLSVHGGATVFHPRRKPPVS